MSTCFLCLHSLKWPKKAILNKVNGLTSQKQNIFEAVCLTSKPCDAKTLPRKKITFFFFSVCVYFDCFIHTLSNAWSSGDRNNNKKDLREMKRCWWTKQDFLKIESKKKIHSVEDSKSPSWTAPLWCGAATLSFCFLHLRKCENADRQSGK